MSKKIVIVVGIVVFVFGFTFTSCKKECKCTFTSIDGTLKFTETYAVDSKKECKMDELWYNLLLNDGKAKCRYK